jgi:transcriptional regulator with PAS, ATPase and Fis domain
MKESLSKLRLEDLTTSNPAMARCLQLAALAAKSDVPVVLLGETGTGKTLLAQAIHNSSARAGRPFVAFNASAISDTLLESQLFGHERGAFTGAQQSLKGKLELADGGTLFLDEISEMSPLAQVKISRARSDAGIAMEISYRRTFRPAPGAAQLHGERRATQFFCRVGFC